MSESYEAVDDNLVRVLPRLVDELGGNPDRLLRKVGLSPKSFLPGEVAPSYRQAIELVALASSELACDDFGMRLAMAQFGTIRSPLSRVIESARTLGEALRLVCSHSYAHSRAVTIWLSLSPPAETATYGLDILLDGVPNRSQAMEQILLIAYQSIRDVTGSRVRARCVTFRHEQISPADVYRRFFGCDVRFGQQADAIIFSASDLDCPIFRQSEADIRAALAAIERSFPERQSPVHAKVRGILMNRLGAERSGIEEVAEDLGYSIKKLSRLLSAEGTTFQAIKNKMRVEITKYYIEDTDLDFGIISERMGFAEQSVFSHFCRKWLDSSPTELRARRRGGCRRAGTVEERSVQNEQVGLAD
jgi:AraC-like DNA-binding protein